MDTLLLDISTWDLVVDANGDIAVASDPYSQAQDAASAIRTFFGEVYYNTTLGIDYSQILGQSPPAALMKKLFINAALTVPGVTSADVFLTTLTNRSISGQVQITNDKGQVAAATFGSNIAPVNPNAGLFKLDFSTLGGGDVLG